MSAPSQLPPPSNPALLPVLATVTYLAALIALWGVTSLVLDREVVDYPDAGPLLGPAMAAVASVVTWVTLWRTSRARSWSWVAVAPAAAYVLMVLVGAAGYSVTRSDAGWLVIAAGHFALSPFVLGAALLSGLAAAIVRVSTR
jgi:hypothetical protein